ncbi:MAG: hypothetical protein AB2L13_12475 [Spirochaetota bacterium]
MNAGLKTDYGTANLGVQLDNHGGFEGFNADFTGSQRGADKFGASQTVGFGYNKDTGYGITSRTSITYGSDWRNMDVSSATTSTYSFDKSGRFTGSTTDTKLSGSYNETRAGERKRKEEAAKVASLREQGLTDDEIRTELEREAAQRRNEMNMMEKAGDMLAGAWLSMNNTLGQWGRDVAGMVSEFGERVSNWAGDKGFNTDQEIVELYRKANREILSANGSLSDSANSADRAWAESMEARNKLKEQGLIDENGNLVLKKGLFEKIADVFRSDAEIQRNNDIALSKMMWDSGEMQKQVDANILMREHEYVYALQNSYANKDVRYSDNNPNNVREFNGNTEEGYARQMYYEALLRQRGVDLSTLQDGGVPIVIGEQGKGAGLYTTNGNGALTGDRYDDRVTKVFMVDGELVFQEFNRSNLDVSARSENHDLNVAAGGYDYIVGQHTDGSMALNIYSVAENIDKITEKQRTDLEKLISKGSLKWQDVRYNYPALRVLPATNGRIQSGINAHAGTNTYTDSDGCFTIYKYGKGGGDFSRFMSTYSYNQRGKFHVFR